jgi:competence protein ComEC
MLLLAFILGMISYHHFYPWYLFICLFWTSHFKQSIIITLVFGLGFCSFKIHHERIKSQSLKFDHNFFSSFLIEIQGFEEKKSYAKRWKVKVKKPIDGIFWLNCYQKCPKMLPGERWWVQAKLKKMTNFQNPGQLSVWYRADYHHINGQMNLISQQFKKDKDISKYDWLNRMKVSIYQKAHTVFNHEYEFARKVFLTLVLGIGSELSQEDWNTFKATGTAHLMVVSGAHLGLLMVLLAWIFEQFYRLYPCFIPVKRIASAVSLSLGFIYALLSGFGIPVQRAWLMRFFMDVKYWTHYRISSWQSFQLSIWVILIFEPHAIFYPGAYLSFLAVGILMLTPKLLIEKKWWVHLLTQAMCLLGLSPLTVLWFSSIPSLGMIANLFAIPWVSWVVLPLALSMSVMLGPIWVKLFDASLVILQKGLQYLQKFDAINLQLSWHNEYLPWYALIGLLAICIYPHWKVIVNVFLMGMILQFSTIPNMQVGEFFVDILDVGQGLSILVRTHGHALLYDTGGMQGKRSFASFVVLPYLKYIQLKKLDQLVLSHPDLDHIAGKKEILAQYPNTKLIVDQPTFYHQGTDCRKMKDWSWDGVSFHFFQGLKNTKKKNDHSCVLLIKNQKNQILLTGDIEKKAEQAILRENQNVHPTVILVPHHGSKTSSSDAFLKAMQAKLAIVSVALNNSYHLPHPLIKKRYQMYHTPWMSTAEEGWIQIQFLKRSWKILSIYKNTITHKN